MTSLIRFDRFSFRPSDGELRRDGSVVKLQPQPARVLAMLLERPGETVTRDELRQRIWGSETFVDFERGLNFCVSQIRFALGDAADAPRFVETVPRRGYRFIAAIDAAPADSVATPEPEAPASSVGAWRLPMVAAAVLVLAAVVLFAGRPWGVAAPAPVFRVAVVPFDNETGDPALDRVAVGISDSTVARLSVPEFIPRVAVVGNAAILRAPRASRDLKVIGSTLGVDYAVLGQLKQDDGKMRLVAHLIRTRDEVHLWANTFDRPTFDLDVQAELAEAIARSVAAQLTAR
jgi:DNA-binding winged helix-turn-helix (wHTH) protein/TolB-like protein